MPAGLSSISMWAKRTSTLGMPQPLIDELVRRSEISADDAAAIHARLAAEGGAADTAILELGVATEGQVVAALFAAYGLSAARSTDTIRPTDVRATQSFPQQWAIKHGLAPLSLDEAGQTLTVLSAAPPNLAVLERLGDALELRIEPLLAPEIRVHQRLTLLYGVALRERLATVLRSLDVVGRDAPSPPIASASVGTTPVVAARPITFAEAVARLRDANSRDEIVQLALEYARRDFELAALLVVHDGRIEGWSALGNGAETITDVVIEPNGKSAFWTCVNSQAHFLGPLSGADLTRVSPLRRSPPRAALIVPLRIRDRPFALLYAENGPMAIAPRLAADLMVYATHVQRAMEAIVLRRKGLSVAAGAPSADPEDQIETAEHVAPPPEHTWKAGDSVEINVDELLPGGSSPDQLAALAEATALPVPEPALDGPVQLPRFGADGPEARIEIAAILDQPVRPPSRARDAVETDQAATPGWAPPSEGWGQRRTNSDGAEAGTDRALQVPAGVAPPPGPSRADIMADAAEAASHLSAPAPEPEAEKKKSRTLLSPAVTDPDAWESVVSDSWEAWAPEPTRTGATAAPPDEALTPPDGAAGGFEDSPTESSRLRADATGEPPPIEAPAEADDAVAASAARAVQDRADTPVDSPLQGEGGAQIDPMAADDGATADPGEPAATEDATFDDLGPSGARAADTLSDADAGGPERGDGGTDEEQAVVDRSAADRALGGEDEADLGDAAGATDLPAAIDVAEAADGGAEPLEVADQPLADPAPGGDDSRGSSAATSGANGAHDAAGTAVSAWADAVDAGMASDRPGPHTGVAPEDGGPSAAEPSGDEAEPTASEAVDQQASLAGASALDEVAPDADGSADSQAPDAAGTAPDTDDLTPAGARTSDDAQASPDGSDDLAQATADDATASGGDDDRAEAGDQADFESSTATGDTDDLVQDAGAASALEAGGEDEAADSDQPASDDATDADAGGEMHDATPPSDDAADADAGGEMHDATPPSDDATDADAGGEMHDATPPSDDAADAAADADANGDAQTSERPDIAEASDAANDDALTPEQTDGAQAETSADSDADSDDAPPGDGDTDPPAIDAANVDALSAEATDEAAAGSEAPDAEARDGDAYAPAASAVADVNAGLVADSMSEAQDGVEQSPPTHDVELDFDDDSAEGVEASGSNDEISPAASAAQPKSVTVAPKPRTRSDVRLTGKPEPTDAPGPSDEKIRGLVARLCGADKGDQRAAQAELHALGPVVLPQLSEAFPGPLWVDPFAKQGVLVPFPDCGPLLWLLSQLGKDAHPYVSPRLEARVPVERFFATYFYAHAIVPEIVPRLIRRLHDEEDRISMLSIRTLRGYKDDPAFEQVHDHLQYRLASPSIDARRHAAGFIGMFRDELAVPSLISVFDKKEKLLYEAARKALEDVTKQSFGTSARKWASWWHAHRDEPRMQWLIDGLDARDRKIRESSLAELEAVANTTMGFEVDAPKRQREDAKKRWQSWFKRNPTARAY